MQPVVETRYRQEQVVTARSVVETHYRNEAYTETVPVTAFDNVTVDEGGYQQVWVPKIVCKQVPKTVYQQRQACRTVPYQVSKCVPEISTRTVPFQTVRYVATNPCPPGTTGNLSTMPALSNYPLPPTSYVPSVPAYTAPAYAAPSPSLSRPTLPGAGPSLGTPQSGGIAPVPDPRFIDTPEASLSPVQQRAERPYENTLGAAETFPSASATGDVDANVYRLPPPLAAKPAASLQANREASKSFVPAPTAATVWRTPRSTVIR
jgi:hypothetical protein